MLSASAALMRGRGGGGQPGAAALTPRLFEQHLPYALALDLEARWIGTVADGIFKPRWYHGSSDGSSSDSGWSGSSGDSGGSSDSSGGGSGW